MKIKILILGNFGETQHFNNLLKDEEIDIVGEVSNTSIVLEKISSTSADMVLVTDTDPVFLRACEQIYLLRPRTIPVVLADKNDPEKVNEITETGVHHILPKTMDQSPLIRGLKSIYNSETNRIRSIETDSTSSNKSKVILVFGTKGGVGKTTLAVNLGLELAQRDNKVCIIDANFQFGNVGNMMDISNPNTIAELLAEESNPNIDSIRQFLSLHNSGINILLAPNNPEDGANITVSQIERIVASLRTYYDYVIIDTASIIDDMLTAFLDAASTVLFVTSSDIVSLRNTKKGLSVLEALGDFEKSKLVLNGTDSQISKGDIERALGVGIWQSFPKDSKTAIASANQGRPFVQSHPESDLSREMERLATKIDGETETRRGRVGRRKTSFKLGNIFNRKKKRR